jgi:hypothetical protein
MTTTVVLPLGRFDHRGITNITMTYGYVVEAVDESILAAAAGRVVEKWRLLAGRVEWDPFTKRFHIRTIPTPHPLPDDNARVTFTVTHLTGKSLGPDYVTEKTTDSFSVLATPPISYFRHPSIPNSMSNYASQKHPLISIHVSHFSDGACVGIVFPHGVFDAIGMGMFIKALDAEIHGKQWDPPKLQLVNVLDRAISNIRDSTPPTNELSLSLTRLKRDIGRAGVATVSRLVASLLYESLWHRSEPRALYLGEAIVKQIVQRVKNEVLAEGKRWVSTGDILFAWLFKVSQLYSVRDVSFQPRFLGCVPRRRSKKYQLSSTQHSNVSSVHHTGYRPP